MSIQFAEKIVASVEHALWSQDCEPQELSQIVENTQVIETVDKFIQNGHIPNLLLCGPHGCGKTVVGKILVQKYFGTVSDRNYLEIIGSIYRGKNVVSEKNLKKKIPDSMADCPNIINFIKKKSSLPPNKYRIVTIHDFDCMTSEAQMALRRIIEIYSEKVRFIFICNEISNIIEAIQSRALILKFHPISSEGIISRLKEIAQLKNLSLNDEIYENITIMSNYDLKQAINYLQVFSRSEEKTMDNFYHLFNIPSIQTVQELIEMCQEKKGMKAYQILDHLIESGYNVGDILDILIKVLIHGKNLTDSIRVVMIKETVKIVLINEQNPSNLHLYKLVAVMIRNI